MIELVVNGAKRQVDSSPEMPLLWALRDLLDLTGTKFGCGMSLCGACTVHLDGQPARSCSTPIGDVAARAVTTIEGVAPTHAVKQAWEALNVPQCGYCQAGQMMSAIALLAENQHPSDAEIDAAMAGNICRCGTYPRIKNAIRTAAKGLAK